MEVIGRYSNHREQEELLRDFVEMVPNGLSRANVQTKKQIHRRLRPPEIDELVDGYEAEATVYQLANDSESTEPRSHCSSNDNVSLVATVPSPPFRSNRREFSMPAVTPWPRSGSQLECDANTVRLALVRDGVRMRDCHGRER